MLDLEELVQEEEKKAPLICLLTTGSDPCSQVEGMVHHKQTLQIRYLFPDIATDMTNRVVLAFVPKYP